MIYYREGEGNRMSLRARGVSNTHPIQRKSRNVSSLRVNGLAAVGSSLRVLLPHLALVRHEDLSYWWEI
jgi:hypothetical protein